jgi:Flp pilus assembly protein TadG
MWRYLRNELGVSGVEFALIAPMLVVLIGGIATGWSYSLQNNEMRDSVETAAKYFIQGGASETVAQSLALSAWPNRPADGTVTVVKQCTCGGSAVSCTTNVCADTTRPQIFYDIDASAVYVDMFIATAFLDGFQLQQSEVVRAR